MADPQELDGSRLRRQVWALADLGHSVRGWWLRLLLATAALIALLVILDGFYRRELYHYTGSAEWMWTSQNVRAPLPSAALFFLPLGLNDRPLRAVAKICGDRQFVLWVNGLPALAGRNRPGFHLDVVPVEDLLNAGENLIAIEARSPTSVGGVLFALDLEPSPEGRRAGDPRGRSAVVSGPHWQVATRWGDGPGVAPGDGVRAPWIWGRPPDHPWSYPTPVLHERPLIHSLVSEPRRRTAADFRSDGAQRWVCDLGGEIEGFLWLGLEQRPTGMVVEVNRAGAGEPAARAAVVALPGERRWLFPGWVSGSQVVVQGQSPPAWIEVVEAVGRPQSRGSG